MIFKVKKLNDTDAVVLNNIKQNEIIATIAPYKIEGLPMLEVPIINPLCCIAKDGGLTKMNKGCAERNRCIELLNQEEDIEKLALNKFLFSKELFVEMKNCSQNNYLLEEQFGIDSVTKYREILGFIEGYKAAQKQYSEEDMRKAYEAGGDSREDDINGDGETEFSEYLQSVQKKQFPVSVELIEDLKIIKWLYK